MTKKKKKVEHQATAEHKIRNASASPERASMQIVSSDHLDDDAVASQAIEHVYSKAKIAASQSQTVSLLDLPLEILFMIFVYVASRDHLEDDCHTIRVVSEGEFGHNLIFHQPALLLLQMRSMISSSGDALTLEQLKDKLSILYELSSDKRLTIEIQELSKEGFHFSILVHIAQCYTRKNRAKEGRLHPKDFDWWLKCTDPLLKCSCVRNIVDTYFVWLMDDIHEKAATAAVDTSETFQRFSSQLRRWLEEDYDKKHRSYWIREALRNYMSAAEWYDRADVLDHYYEACECPMDTDSDLDLE
ncbi:hypothetical protein QM012_001392 [Aureobasidium pullulans]|uniref:F-box domain-containing protein n=1 Tax=Aureobasidium pullulans TaxID=5580 RepID=A0ABR0TDW3_AURPU